MMIVLVCAHGKDHLQILVQPVAITVVATQLTLLLPPAGMKMKSPKNARSILYLLSSKSIQETISKGPVPVIVPPTTMVPVSELGTGLSHLKYKSSHWNAN